MSRIETGRTEHRMDVSLPGRLETAGAHTSELVMIRNLSSHGARVICTRPWDEHAQVNLAETVGDYHLDAEVVYCERLSDNRYAVGLRFDPAGQAQSPTDFQSYW